MDSDATRVGIGRCRIIERLLEERGHRRICRRIGTRPARGRHLTRAHLSQDLFPKFRAGARVIDIGVVQRKARHLQPVVVAADAVGIDDGARNDRG